MAEQDLAQHLPDLRQQVWDTIERTPQPNLLLSKLSEMYKDKFRRDMRKHAETSTNIFDEVATVIGQDCSLNPIETLFFSWSFIRHLELEQMTLMASRAGYRGERPVRRALQEGDTILENQTIQTAERFIEGFSALGLDRVNVQQWFESMERAGAHTAVAFTSGLSNFNADLISGIVSRIKYKRGELGISDARLLQASLKVINAVGQEYPDSNTSSI